MFTIGALALLSASALVYLLRFATSDNIESKIKDTADIAHILGLGLTSLDFVLSIFEITSVSLPLMAFALVSFWIVGKFDTAQNRKVQKRYIDTLANDGSISLSDVNELSKIARKDIHKNHKIRVLDILLENDEKVQDNRYIIRIVDLVDSEDKEVREKSLDLLNKAVESSPSSFIVEDLEDLSRSEAAAYKLNEKADVYTDESFEEFEPSGEIFSPLAKLYSLEEAGAEAGKDDIGKIINKIPTEIRETDELINGKNSNKTKEEKENANQNELVCPECGAEIDADDSYCIECGIGLNQNLCRGCKEIINEGGEFCIECEREIKA